MGQVYTSYQQWQKLGGGGGRGTNEQHDVQFINSYLHCITKLTHKKLANWLLVNFILYLSFYVDIFKRPGSFPIKSFKFTFVTRTVTRTKLRVNFMCPCNTWINIVY